MTPNKVYLLVIIFLSIPFYNNTLNITIKRTLDLSSNQYEAYLRAMHDYTTGNTISARPILENILKQTEMPLLYEHYLRILFDSCMFDKIISIVEKKWNLIKDIVNTEEDIKLLVAQSYAFVGNDKKASVLFNELEKQFPSNNKVAYYFAINLLRREKYKETLAFIKKKLSKKTSTKNFLLYFLKAKIHLILGDQGNALKAIQESISLFPLFDKSWLLKATIDEQSGKIDDAIKGYERFLDIVGSDTSVAKILVRLLYSKGNYSKAEKYLKKLNEDSCEYYFDLALLNFYDKKYSIALDYINQSLDKSFAFKKGKLLKIEILSANNNNDLLFACLKQWIIENPDDADFFQWLLLLIKKNISRDTVIDFLESIIQEKSKSTLLFAVLADLYLEKGMHDASITYYQKAIEENKQTPLNSRLLFQLAYGYFIAKDYNDLEQTLHKAINECDPVYPSAYNLLAYHYAKNRDNFDEALKLIEKAIADEIGKTIRIY